MFQSLRQSNQIYILHKTEEPTLEMGTVVSVSAPTPKYATPMMFGQQQEMVIDLMVKVAGQDINYQKLPANADIADFGNTGITISCSKEAMNSEVTSLRQRSLDTIASVDYHKKVVSRCDEILASLNPEYAEKRMQQEEINELKRQMQSLLEMNREMMEQLKGSSSSHKPKRNENDSDN